MSGADQPDSVAKCHNMPTLTPAQARVLLLVSLEPQTASNIADRLAERGHLTAQADAKRYLDQLAGLGLLECERAPGRAGWRYWLGRGGEVERALDQAHELTRQT